ncbi:putative anthocyanidin 3-O-glucosyltransferase [Helianthus anomalus]
MRRKVSEFCGGFPTEFVFILTISRRLVGISVRRKVSELAKGDHESYATIQRNGVYPHHLYQYYSANSSAGYAQQYGGRRTKGIGKWLDENGFESRVKGRGFFFIRGWAPQVRNRLYRARGYFVDTFMSL